MYIYKKRGGIYFKIPFLKDFCVKRDTFLQFSKEKPIHTKQVLLRKKGTSFFRKPNIEFFPSTIDKIIMNTQKTTWMEEFGYSILDIVHKEKEFIDKFAPKDLLEKFSGEKEHLKNNISTHLLEFKINQKEKRTRWISDNKRVEIRFFDKDKELSQKDINVTGLFYFIKVVENIEETTITLHSYFSDGQEFLEVEMTSRVNIKHTNVSLKHRKIIQLYIIDAIRRYNIVYGEIKTPKELEQHIESFIDCFLMLDSNQAIPKTSFDEFGVLNFENCRC